MSLIVFKGDRVWFGNSVLNTLAYCQSGDYVCDLSSLALQMVSTRKHRYLLYYDSTTGATERMVLRNFLPQQMAKYTKIDRSVIVEELLPAIEEEFKKIGCLHLKEDGKQYSLGASFILASSTGIYEIDSNLDVSEHSSFYISSDSLRSAVFSEEGPITIDKAREAIDGDSWHYYAGQKIYDPQIIGFLDDSTYLLYDCDSQPQEIKEEELECH